jgi:hypothetical protein
VNDSAIWETTRPFRINCRPRPRFGASPHTLSLSAETTSTRDTLSAGPRPNTIVARAQKLNVAPSTRASGVESNVTAIIGRSDTTVDAINRPPHQATQTPRSPPANESIDASVSSSRTMVHRPAPTARRIAISRCLRPPRASSMLARFSVATSRSTTAIASTKKIAIANGSPDGGLAFSPIRAGGPTDNACF